MSKRVTLIVYGDIGRSPRMQYHALSLADNGYSVDFVGYAGTEPLESVTSSPKIHIHHIPTPSKIRSNLPRPIYLLFAIWRVLMQALGLFWLLLFTLSRPDYILVQNPPSFPTLYVAQVVAWLRSSRLIIDWHNFGYSLMALNLSKESRIVKFAEWYERRYGRSAHGHMTVTKAMKEFIVKDWGVRGDVVVMYDKAPVHFRKLTLPETHKFLLSLPFTRVSDSSTYLTTQSSPSEPAIYTPNRPALLVSSTSWTEDEDFGILLNALVKYNECVAASRKSSKSKSKSNNNTSLPDVFLVITGKGPLKSHYEARIQQLSMKHVQIHTAWLKAEDYPLLLGAADLGVCLHTSSSELDLPMKVVDMFGCGLPVCAVGYQCLDELVKHGKNGCIFNSEQELCEQFIELFSDWTDTKSESRLDRLRKGVKEFQAVRWQDNWNKNARKLFQ